MKTTADEAACMIAGNELAKKVWDDWARADVEPLLAATATIYLVEQVMDSRPELRAGMRAGLAACIDEPREGETKGLTSNDS